MGFHGYTDKSKDVTLNNIKVTFHCNKLQKDVVSDVTESDFCHESDSCDLCGSHGKLSVDVKCECGKYHEIVLNTW